MNQPDDIRLDPFCYFYCQDWFPSGCPREVVHEASRCECSRPRCRHGQDLLPKPKMAVILLER